MILQQRAVGTFANYEDTEMALRDLKGNGFIMEQISVIGPDIDKNIAVTGVNTSPDLVNLSNLHTDKNKADLKAADGAIAGMTVGGFAGLLVGLGALAIPGVGPVLLAGTAATALATTLSGGAIGAAVGSLAGGLVGLGIPADRAKVYNDLITKGNYLVIIEGSSDDIISAETIFANHNIENWYTYDLNDESKQTDKPVLNHS